MLAEQTQSIALIAEINAKVLAEKKHSTKRKMLHLTTSMPDLSHMMTLLEKLAVSHDDLWRSWQRQSYAEAEVA
jgi:hypothetical protein